MIKGNKALRDYAIPFISNYVEATDSGPYGSNALSTPQFITSTSLTAAVPMCQPEKGDIVEAYLFMEMTAPSDMGLSVRLGIGTFVSVSTGALIVPTTAYSEAYLADMHRLITGTDTPFTIAANGTLTIDADITRALKKRGESGFLADAFVLLVTFDELPSSANGYSLDKFKLSCTAQMGLGT